MQEGFKYFKDHSISTNTRSFQEFPTLAQSLVISILLVLRVTTGKYAAKRELDGPWRDQSRDNTHTRFTISRRMFERVCTRERRHAALCSDNRAEKGGLLTDVRDQEDKMARQRGRRRMRGMWH
ncbi:uncharacterized protein LOC143187248 [Calliopsis andreniformis]|uniref:uncharacterized protein LOC143187248 n=1 Tax=Calliopsis andreniformis TaxID=337506 RepID=UPI003FCD3A64